MWRKSVIVMATLALAACSSWHRSGTITRKDYSAPWVQTQCDLIGKTVWCHPVYWPAEYHLHVRDGAGKSHTIEVPESTYTAAHIGDQFQNGE